MTLLKVLLESRGPRLVDCQEEHWDNMKGLIVSEAKQSKTCKNHAMWALISTSSQSRCVGEVGKLGIGESKQKKHDCF